MMGMYKRDGSCGAESKIDRRKISRWRRRLLKALRGLVERQMAAGLRLLGVQWTPGQDGSDSDSETITVPEWLEGC